MKSFAILKISMLGVMTLLIGIASADSNYYMTGTYEVTLSSGGTYLNCRQKPNVRSPKLKVFHKGDQIEVVEVAGASNPWLKIDTGCYVRGHANYLKKIELSELNQNSVVQSFTAFGSTWRAVVENGKLFLEGPVLNATSISVERLAYAKGVEFFGHDGNKEVNLNIRGVPCQDSSGNKSEFTASLVYGKKTMKGCAVAGVIEEAPT